MYFNLLHRLVPLPVLVVSERLCSGVRFVTVYNDSLRLMICGSKLMEVFLLAPNKYLHATFIFDCRYNTHDGLN
mgnify:CR=1 FL=1